MCPACLPPPRPPAWNALPPLWPSIAPTYLCRPGAGVNSAGSSSWVRCVISLPWRCCPRQGEGVSLHICVTGALETGPTGTFTVMTTAGPAWVRLVPQACAEAAPSRPRRIPFFNLISGAQDTRPQGSVTAAGTRGTRLQLCLPHTMLPLGLFHYFFLTFTYFFKDLSI